MICAKCGFSNAEGTKFCGECGLDIRNTAPAIAGFTLIGKNEQGYEEYKHEKTGMVFVKVPAGKFKMGSNDFLASETPVHEVTVKSFLISKYEVTQEDWYDQNYYAKSPKENPKGPASGESRVLRGGSWRNYCVFDLRSAYRLSTDPAHSWSGIGLRAAQDSE